MGRKKLSEYPPEVAARMRAEISEKNRQAWAAGKFAGRSNGVYNEGVADRIAQTIKDAWAAGTYDDRENGMTGARASRNPVWAWGKWQYAAIATQFHGATCMACGATDDLNTHHFDEDHDNYLLSNLGTFCVACHAWKFHYQRGGGRRPFVTIEKRFDFEYSHVLPWHPGKCGRVHGHSGKLAVTLTARLDGNGVVEDFYDVGRIVKLALVEPLDHRMLNDFLPNPTSEEFLPWAWHRLEVHGLKALSSLTFSETASSSCTITKAQMVEAYGWDKEDDCEEFVLVAKPIKEGP